MLVIGLKWVGRLNWSWKKGGLKILRIPLSHLQALWVSHLILRTFLWDKTHFNSQGRQAQRNQLAHGHQECWDFKIHAVSPFASHQKPTNSSHELKTPLSIIFENTLLHFLLPWCIFELSLCWIPPDSVHRGASTFSCQTSNTPSFASTIMCC